MFIQKAMRSTAIKKRIKRKIQKMQNRNMNKKGTRNWRFDCT